MGNNSKQLSKDTLLPLLRKRIAELEMIKRSLEGSLKKAPSGFLSISSHQGAYQYYFVEENAERTETYISRDKFEVAQEIAQRDYDRIMLKELSTQLNVLKKCVAKYNVNKLEECFEKLHIARRPLVQPLILSDDKFVEDWKNVFYEGKTFEENGSKLYTARGEQVRSKSEIIIADTLARLNIPYRYEYPHLFFKMEDLMRREMDGHRKSHFRPIRVYPDFTCLNVRTRQEFIWEHFGLVDSSTYAENMNEKRNMYTANDYYNLIVTQETKTKPLSPWIVERLARHYLL